MAVKITEVSNLNAKIISFPVKDTFPYHVWQNNTNLSSHKCILKFVFNLYRVVVQVEIIWRLIFVQVTTCTGDFVQVATCTGDVVQVVTCT